MIGLYTTLLALLGLVAAARLPDALLPRFQTVTCSKVESCLKSAAANPSATAFCRSYLASTFTKRVTKTAVSVVTLITGAHTTSVTVVECGETTLMSSTTPAPASSTKSDPPVPGCLTQYPSETTLSSACSCVSAPVETKIATTTKIVTVSTMKTKTVHSATATVSVLSPPPCGKVGNFGGNGKTFNNYFSGCYMQETANDPAGAPVAGLTFPPIYTTYYAIDECASNAIDRSDSSISLYHMRDGYWQCLIYDATNSTARHLDVESDQVLDAYGYSQ